MNPTITENLDLRAQLREAFGPLHKLDLINGADLFCGAGGTSNGLEEAAEEAGFELHTVLVNHWRVAIETIRKNHPNAIAINSDLERVDPRVAVPSGYLRILVASPECTHYSNAAGGRPKNKQSRATPKWILKWMSLLDIEDVLLENVKEFMTWGPLHRTCICGVGTHIEAKKHKRSCHFEKPIKSRKGEYFKRFIAKMRSFGYTVDWRVINCADYGDPTTRQRLFIQARKYSPMTWPKPTHSRTGKTVFGRTKKWVTARDILDLDHKGESIFTRAARGKAPLVPNTLRRIAEGLHRYSGLPFVIGQQSLSMPRSIDAPIPTIASSGSIHYIEPFLVPYKTESGHQHARVHSIDEPIPTITAAHGFSLVQPFLMQLDQTGSNGKRTRSLDEPLYTLTSKGQIALIEPYLVVYNGTANSASLDEPLPTITSKDRLGLVEPIIVEIRGQRYLLDILHRMLTIKELARGQSFYDNYEFHGTQEQVKKQIGNAVPRRTAKALCYNLLTN